MILLLLIPILGAMGVFGVLGAMFSNNPNTKTITRNLLLYMTTIITLLLPTTILILLELQVTK